MIYKREHSVFCDNYKKLSSSTPRGCGIQGLNHLAAVLHLAIFFGCSRLVGLAEAALAASLQQPASSDFGAFPFQFKVRQCGSQHF